MLAVTTVPAHLRSRGSSAVADDAWTVRQLTGGVSGAVFSAFDGRERFVVKQSLDKLAVDDDWSAPRERILNEARALDLLGEIIPTHSPTVLDVDPETLTLTMEHAPSDWTDWKGELLSDAVDAPLTRRLGEALATVHAATANAAWSIPPDDGAAGFLALRIEPFHHTVAERMPEFRVQLLGIAERILDTRECFVHGDFSPKNILVAPPGADRGFWIIDDEVAHRGDPVFDLAFFLSHLALKRIRATDDVKPLFDQAARAFVEGYQDIRGDIDSSALSQQIGALVLSRIAGRSPVRYLDQRQRDAAVAVGAQLLTHSADFRRTHPLEII